MAPLLVAIAALAPAIAWSQPSATPELNVSIRPQLAYVGEEMRAAVYVEGALARSVKGLSLELRFPSALMHFTAVEPGYLLERKNGTAQSRTTAEADGISAVLITVAAKMGVPDGLIVYLVFRVDPSAPLGVEIPLKTRAENTTTAGAPQPIPFPEEVISVSRRKKEEEVPFACFFYMH